jgi:radical SAM-linked protein
MNRLRIRFKREEEIKFISHLDLTRVWQRAFRRAGVEMVYSDGFTPHPRLSLAAPLALGVTSSCELMDVYTVKAISGPSLDCMVSAQLPAGLKIDQVCSVPLELPTLQSQLRFAEYMVQVVAAEADVIKHSIDSLMSKDSLPWGHRRDVGVKSYDLRPLINSLCCEASQDMAVMLRMKLRCDSNGAGRPEQVVLALGLGIPLSIQRTRLFLQS